jgi:hypothetical protein
MVVRFSQLRIHSLQRPVSEAWVKDLAVNHFEGGQNVQKAVFPLVLLLIGEEFDSPACDDKLPMAPQDREFYIISGQHRVSAMKQLINRRLVTELQTFVHPEDILADPEAEWPAIVYSESELDGFIALTSF